MPYRCREHDDDLTDAIRQDLGTAPETVMVGLTSITTAGATSTGQTRTGRVVVTCAHGHDNAFDITYTLAPHQRPQLVDPPQTIDGVMPTADDRLLQAASATLSPDQSLGRVEDYAKTLIGNVGLVGTILTGFALLDRSALHGAEPYLVIAIVASALSLLIALISLFIQPTHVVVGDLDAVRDLFAAQLRIRTPLTMAAGGLLFVALAAATVGVIVALG